MVRFSRIVCILVLSLYAFFSASAETDDKQAMVDSLVSEALNLTKYGRFQESSGIFNELLNKPGLRFSKDSKKNIYGCMGCNARLDGDYSEYCKYLSLQGYNKKDADWLFYSALATVPKQSLSRPDSDIQVSYSIDSVYIENEFRGCLIRLPVKVGGKEEMMVLDNGCANFSAVSESFATGHGIRPIEAQIKTNGTVGSAESKMGVADSISIGEMVFKNVLFIILPDKSFPSSITDVSAILGANIFRLAGEMIFDNADRTLTFPSFQREVDSNVEIDGDGCYSLDVVANNDTLKFHLDLGAARTHFSSNYFTKNKDVIESTCVAGSKKTGGIGGVKEEKVYYLKDVALYSGGGSFEMEEIMVSTEAYPAQHTEDGLLGNDFILSFDKVVLNLRKMFLVVPH